MNALDLGENGVVKLKPCPNCGMDVELIQKSERLLAFVCPPDSPCRGSGLFLCADAEKRDSAIEAFNRRRIRWDGDDQPSEFDRLCREN